MEHAETTAAGTTPELGALRLKIGVMGGASGALTPEVLDHAHALGRAIARNGSILITGGCPGLPLAAACGAKEENGLVIGISPGLSLDEHVYKYGSPTEFHDALIFTGSGLMGREVVNIRSSDIVVIIGGRSGTLGELAISYDEGKLIGVLTGTGGISDMVKEILAVCEKKTGARLIYDSDPERLIEQLLHLYRTEHYRRPSCFCQERPIGEHGGAAGAMRDPVCGMTLDPAAIAAEHVLDGRRYVFCSTICANRFAADPKTYLGEGASND